MQSYICLSAKTKSLVFPLGESCGYGLHFAVSFGEGGSARTIEPRRKGTINYYFIPLCVFIPYRQNLAYALFCHFPRRRKRTTVIIISVYSLFLPLSSLRDTLPIGESKIIVKRSYISEFSSVVLHLLLTSIDGYAATFPRGESKNILKQVRKRTFRLSDNFLLKTAGYFSYILLP